MLRKYFAYPSYVGSLIWVSEQVIKVIKMLFSFQTLCLIPTFVPTCSIFLTLYLEVKKYEYYIYMTFTIHKQIRLMYFSLAFEMSYLVCTDSCVGELSQQCSIDGKISLIILKTISDRKSR